MSNRVITQAFSPILGYFEDDRVVEIMLNGDGNLYVDRLGEGIEHVGRLEPSVAKGMILSLSRHADIDNDLIVETRLPEELMYARMEAVFPPLADEVSFSIRIPRSQRITLDDYVANGSLSQEKRDFLVDAFASGANVLIAGGTGSGKTTFANALLAEVPSDQRSVVIEDTPELQVSGNVQRLYTTKDVDQLALLKVTMRLRPDRIVVGEVRDASALALLKAWNTGHGGGIATVHANGLQESLQRIKTLAEEGLSGAMLDKQMIADAIGAVAFIKKRKDGSRTVRIGRVSKDLSVEEV